MGRSDHFSLDLPKLKHNCGRVAQKIIAQSWKGSARPHPDTSSPEDSIHTKVHVTHTFHITRQTTTSPGSRPSGRSPGYKSRDPQVRGRSRASQERPQLRTPPWTRFMAPVSLRPIPAVARGLGSFLLATL